MNILLGFFLIVLFNVALAIDSDGFISVDVEIINKVTSEKSDLSLPIGEEVVFENMLITAKRCIFDDDVDVYYVLLEIFHTNFAEKSVFSGWLSSNSISLNSFENPVYDINVSSNCRYIGF